MVRLENKEGLSIDFMLSLDGFKELGDLCIALHDFCKESIGVDEQNVNKPKELLTCENIKNYSKISALKIRDHKSVSARFHYYAYQFKKLTLTRHCLRVGLYMESRKSLQCPNTEKSVASSNSVIDGEAQSVVCESLNLCLWAKVAQCLFFLK